MSLKEEFHASEEYRSAYAKWMYHAAASAHLFAKDREMDHFKGSSPYWLAFNKWLDIAYPI
jgi:hypothetical protein